MRSATFPAAALAIAAGTFALALLHARTTGNQYYLFAGFVVLQYVVLATAWNILGGYCGYVNFGTAAFFAIGAYTVVALHRLGANPGRYLSGTPAEVLMPLFPLSMPGMILASGVASGIVGLGMGYLTLRLRGVFFAIATLALAIVLRTIVINWDFVGGSRGAYVIRPGRVSVGPVSLSYVEYLLLTMLVLAVLAIWVARLIERSQLGFGFTAIRDDELAAEASGVPTLRLKLIATTLSGALMGMAGAPLPYYNGYVEPSAAFGLTYAVNAIAMPMIGGTTTWMGPLIGAILLGTLQQIATVTVSSVVNLLIVGMLLVAFVIAAPVGIVGLIREFLRTAASSRLDLRSVALIGIAGYCFIVGVLGVIFNLQAVQAGSAGAVALGAFGLIVAGLYLVASWGLLKLQAWGPLLGSAAFASAALEAALHMALEGILRGAAARWVAIAAAVAAIWYLQDRGVKLLYRADSSTRPMPA